MGEIKDTLDAHRYVSLVAFYSKIIWFQIEVNIWVHAHPNH